MTNRQPAELHLPTLTRGFQPLECQRDEPPAVFYREGTEAIAQGRAVFGRDVLKIMLVRNYTPDPEHRLGGVQRFEISPNVGYPKGGFPLAGFRRADGGKRITGADVDDLDRRFEDVATGLVFYFPANEQRPPVLYAYDVLPARKTWTISWELAFDPKMPEETRAAVLASLDKGKELDELLDT